MSIRKFPISTEDSELLLLFEELKDISTISQVTGRDASGVSRSLKRLAETYPVLEKLSGRWRLTMIGKELNNIHRNFIQLQSLALERPLYLRLGTNREFLSRILAPKLDEIMELMPKTTFELMSYEKGIEQKLKEGRIDIGFDCGRPFDPDISYKLLCPEPIAVYCSPKFSEKNRKIIESNQWKRLPHVLCERLEPRNFTEFSEQELLISLKVNDISAAREVAKRSLGWVLLPTYTVLREIENKELVQMVPTIFGGEQYGIWWLRRRKHLNSSIDVLSSWMQNISLSEQR